MSEQQKVKETGFVLVLSQDRMGHGDDTLGVMLMKKFLKTFVDIAPVPSYVLCFNAGVKLTVEDSEVLGELKALESKGTTILNCGTCLDYFNLRDKLRAGHISNMHEIVGVMTNAERSVTL